MLSSHPRRLFLVASLVVSVTGGDSVAGNQDPWSPGVRREEWTRIETIQRFPLYDAEPQFDWTVARRDESYLVRAAAAAAIGRSRDEKWIPLLNALLNDEMHLVRRFALAALLQIDSPLIKEPLLKAIDSWSDDE